MAEVCVIMLNMGGPERQDQVGSYLKSVFSDPNLIRMPLKKLLGPLIVAARTPKVRSRYAMTGGGSPLPAIARKQAELLENALCVGETNRYKAIVGMRYSAPTIEDALNRAVESGCKRIVALSMYPHFCSATIGSSLLELERLKAHRGEIPDLCTVDRYFDHPLYIKALSSSVEKAILRCAAEPFVLFSAHGIPKSLETKGDPYVAEIDKTASLTAQRLGLPRDRWQVSFQSRMGPMKWTGPHTEQVIRKLAADGKKEIVLVPISFTADNLETLYDMDIVLADAANKAGIQKMLRAPALNDDAEFILALAEIVRKAADSY